MLKCLWKLGELMNEEKLTHHIAENITYYRKKMNLTQMELAERLGYSDKSISKWERKEGVPSVYVLNELSEFFGITLNDMISEVKIEKINVLNKRVLSYFYGSIPLCVSLIIFGLFILFEVK